MSIQKTRPFSNGVNLAMHRIQSLPVVAEFIALAGAFVFLLQALQAASRQASILDEGLYLVKGFLFTSGRYIPFQPDGPWTNQMPLSYLIPGAIQLVFGTGLRTGRIFSVILGVLILLGLWLLARRLAGRWWAAATVLAAAINPAYWNGYSMAVSQVLVACILTWILVLAIDENAPLWRLCLASLSAGLLLLVRVNMTPVLPVLLLYIFWQHGWKAGAWSSLAGGLAVLILHAVYWPGILQMWASWIPGSLTPFLDPWRIEDLGVAVWNPAIGWEDRLASLWDGVRFNFIPVLSLALFGILVFQPKYWAKIFYYRTAVLFSALSLILVAAHAWAALLKNYCVFCFAGYLEFFSPVMILIAALAFKAWRPGKNRAYALYVLLVVPLLYSGAAFGASRVIGPWLIELPVPRLGASAGSTASGTIPLWGLLENGLGIGYKTARWLAPTLAGLGVGLLLIGLARIAQRQRWFGHSNYGLATASLAMILGMILTPLPFLTGDTPLVNPDGTAATQPARCEGNVIAALETVETHLAEAIPADALVYWQGSLSAVPLLAIPDARIFPAQLNDGYTYRIGGDTTRLRQFGLWNDVLKDQWLDEADFIILQQRYYDQEWKTFLESGAFDELSPTVGTDPCAENSYLRIFRRTPNG
ncbi:MAG: glycosyltransferase family 39 protein [Anaerolineales bacterium]|nr:glycosyltransferase family 39 protein [Anaerolineales bacterium]